MPLFVKNTTFLNSPHRPKQAAVWVNAGIRDLDDLKKKQWENLSSNQKIGVDHYDVGINAHFI